MLQLAIEKNRKREARFNKAERMLRRLRQRVFDYQDAGRADKADRLILRCKARLAPRWEARHQAYLCANMHSIMVSHGAD